MHVAGFLLVAVVVIVTPGQDTALTIRNTLLGGRCSGIGTAAFAVAKAGDLLRRSAVRRSLDAILGVVLVALGLRVATERR